MKTINWLVAALAAIAIPASGQSPAQIKPTLSNNAVLAGPAMPTTSPPVSEAHEPTKSDVDAWLDGFMPYALKAGGIPGAVVVVVKDGQTLTERGFGYSDVQTGKPVDPQATLFRPGSVSKLFTWTAVMQQVQAGKLNLDADVNQYLDFKIPARDGKPITLRNLMTHTPGFAETAKWLIMFGYDKKPASLHDALTRQIPERIYAPGEIPAYSNYGASLAGYIVERVSGEPFNQYVQRHIFEPLGMTRSTFNQPLPPAMRPMLSKAYKDGTTAPQPYEVIDLAPAGSVSSTGDDMGKFMIAHLNNGGQLLNPQTAQLMYAPANQPFSALPAMALGFYHEDRNGLRIVGHGGDTVFFHSDLHLLLDKKVGLYISMNSLGKNGAAHALREDLLQQFVDRYYPASAAQLPTAGTAKAHGEALAGRYVSSRAGGFNFLRMVALLGEPKVSVDNEGFLSVSGITDPAGNPRRWREVGSWVWQEVNGADKLQAVLDGHNHVRMFSITPYAPIIEFVPAPGSLNAGWILPAAGLALIILLIAAIGWPVSALVRRRYKAVSSRSGRSLQLYRGTRIGAWLFVVLLVGWAIIVQFLSNDLAALDSGLDIWMRLLQLILILAIVATIIAIWNVVELARTNDRHWTSLTWAVVVTLALAFFAWLALNLGLLTTSLSY